MDSLLSLADTATGAVGVAAILAALLPRPAPGSRLSLVFRVLDILGQNYMNARNAQASPPPSAQPSAPPPSNWR